jgi:hypothetical protein
MVISQVGCAMCFAHHNQPVGWTDEGSPTEIKIRCWSSPAQSNLHGLQPTSLMAVTLVRGNESHRGCQAKTT